MLLSVREQVLEVLVRAVRLDVHTNADLLVAGRHGVVEPEQALQVEVAGELCRQFPDDNPARHGMQDKGGRYAASKGVQQEFDRVCALVFPSRTGGSPLVNSKDALREVSSRPAP